MAEFKTLIITEQGQRLLARTLVEGGEPLEFTKVSLSDHEYDDDTLPSLTEIESVRQTAKVLGARRLSDTSVQVDAVITNEELSEGYYIKTVALYANTTAGEIIYAVCGASVPAWMPPHSETSNSGASFKLITAISNTTNIVVNADPTAVATLNDIQSIRGDIERLKEEDLQEIRGSVDMLTGFTQQVFTLQSDVEGLRERDQGLQEQLTDLKTYVGLVESDVYGVEVDFRSNQFTRLSAAEGLSPGADFDLLKALGKRRRCILTDDGVVLAYYGEKGYTETGKLEQSIEKNGKTYPVGTNVQVMVEQPKFYYKCVPLKLEKIKAGKGYHMRRVRYYVTDTPKEGFKPHPIFVEETRDGTLEREVVYLAAFEACGQDPQTKRYALNRDMSFDVGPIFASVAGAYPLTGDARSCDRNGQGRTASQRGTGWRQQTIHSICLTQLLFLIEYASFNMQTYLGVGISGDDTYVGQHNELITGGTSALGNSTGSVIDAQGFNSVSYRGEENLYSRVGKWLEDIDLNARSNGEVYISPSDRRSSNGQYGKHTGLQVSPKAGFVSAFAYTPMYDWLFLPSETKGNSVLPTGLYYQTDDMNKPSDELHPIVMCVPERAFEAIDHSRTEFKDTLSFTAMRKSDLWGVQMGARLLYLPEVEPSSRPLGPSYGGGGPYYGGPYY